MMRIHPAIIAQAAATAADMFRGRFFLGVGTGENLNEHILGERWPSADERRDMLEEAVALIRMLWVGKEISFDGAYYSVRDARIYTLPEKLPPIYVAASGPMAAELASRIGDGLISTAPDPKVIEAFGTNGGQPKPRIGQVSVVWHADEAQARHIAHEYWPAAAVHGEISQELPLPRHFEQAVQDVTEDQVAKMVVCGSEVERHVEAIEKFAEAGFDEVYVHQIGPEQEEFFRAYEREVLPELRRALAAA
jgi:G6PDH family F420-dependent oxidoreductase